MKNYFLPGLLRWFKQTCVYAAFTCVCLSLLSSVLHAQDLTLEASFSRFLERNPLVASEKERIEIARGKLRQSSSWQNPVLNYTQENYPIGEEGSSFDDQEFGIWLTQEFELGGKRDKRRTLAQIDLEIEEARFRDFLRIQQGILFRLYIKTYYSSSRKATLENALSEYKEIRDTHQKLYSMGEVSGLSQMKLETEEYSYLTQLARAERDLNAAWNELASMIVWEDPELPRLSLERSLPSNLNDSVVYIRSALNSRPDLEVLRLEVQSSETAVEAEKAKNIPNINLGGGYKRVFGQNSYFFGAQLPLPIWDRREGAIEESLAAERRQRMLTDWKEIWIRNEVERVHRIFSRLLAASKGLDHSYSQRLDQIVEITSLSYQKGEAGILEYLDALRTKRDALVEQSRLLQELHLAHVDLEIAVGKRLHEIRP